MYVGPSPKFPNLAAPCSEGAKPAEIQLRAEEEKSTLKLGVGRGKETVHSLKLTAGQRVEDFVLFL